MEKIRWKPTAPLSWKRQASDPVPAELGRPCDNRRDPALSRSRSYAHGDRVAYFDGPGGTQVPRVVVEAMTNYLVHHNANTHWVFPTSEETTRRFRGAAGPGRLSQRLARRDRLRRQYDHDDVPSGKGLGASTRSRRRDIVTELDHHANIDPWREWSPSGVSPSFRSRMVPETGELDWNDLDRCLTDHRTRLLAIGAASNARERSTTWPGCRHGPRGRGAVLCGCRALRAAQLVDVQAWGCDFLACSAYKLWTTRSCALR